LDPTNAIQNSDRARRESDGARERNNYGIPRTKE
jgi:hypothetical protein